MPIQVSPYEEISAIRRLCKAQWSLPPSEIYTASPDLYGTVTGFFNKALDLHASAKDPLLVLADRTRRCLAIRLFIGRPVDSFKKLTRHECQILVDHLKAQTEDGKLKISGEGMALIQWADAYLEDNPSAIDDEEPAHETAYQTDAPVLPAQVQYPQAESCWPDSAAELW